VVKLAHTQPDYFYKKIPPVSKKIS